MRDEYRWCTADGVERGVVFGDPETVEPAFLSGLGDANHLPDCLFGRHLPVRCTQFEHGLQDGGTGAAGANGHLWRDHEGLLAGAGVLVCGGLGRATGTTASRANAIAKAAAVVGSDSRASSSPAANGPQGWTI